MAVIVERQLKLVMLFILLVAMSMQIVFLILFMLFLRLFIDMMIALGFLGRLLVNNSHMWFKIVLHDSLQAFINLRANYHVIKLVNARAAKLRHLAWSRQETKWPDHLLQQKLSDCGALVKARVANLHPDAHYNELFRRSDHYFVRDLLFYLLGPRFINFLFLLISTLDLFR